MTKKNLSHNILSASIALDVFLQRSAANVGLNVRNVCILFLCTSPKRPSELQRALALPKETVRRTCESMWNQGLLNRTQKHWEISAAGSKTVLHLSKGVEQSLEMVMKNVPLGAATENVQIGLQRLTTLMLETHRNH